LPGRSDLFGYASSTVNPDGQRYERVIDDPTCRPARLSLLVILSPFWALMPISAATTHPDADAHHSPLPLHATDNMRAFANNDHSPQNLEAVASTGCVGGFAGIYPCNNVDLEAFMPLAAIGGTSGNSARGATTRTSIQAS
jgi:hypothetical protein